MKIGPTKKSMGFALCMLMLILAQLVAACGGSSNSSSNAHGTVDLNVWMYPAVPEVSAPPADWDLYKVVRQKLNINLKVTLIPVGDDGDTKMSAAAAANNLPDLFQITNTNLFLQWVNLGLVAPVDNLLPMMPERTKARYSDPTLNKLGTINGKMYVLQEPSPLNKRMGVFIRKDWLDKLGLKAPTTPDELLNVAKAFTFNDPDGDGKNDTYGFGTFASTSTVGLGPYFSALFGAYGLPGTWNYNTSGKLSLSVRDPGYLQAVEFFKKMSDARVVDPDWPTLTTNDFRARWKQGKYGIFPEDFCAALCQANYQAFDTNQPNAVLVPFAFPQGSSSPAFIGASINAGFRMGVSKKAMDAGKGPAIAKLLEWLNSGEGYYLAGFGKEGVNYKLDAKGNISTEGLSAPFTSHEVAPYIQIRNSVLNNSPAELAVRYPSFKTKNGRTIDPIKQVYDPIAAMPWQDQTSSYAIQPASNQADINRYIDEGLVQFMTGQKPLSASTWDAYIKGLDGLNVSDWEAKANQTLQQKGLLK